jgi:hypothetical protein
MAVSHKIQHVKNIVQVVVTNPNVLTSFSFDHSEVKQVDTSAGLKFMNRQDAWNVTNWYRSALFLLTYCTGSFEGRTK